MVRYLLSALSSLSTKSSSRASSKNDDDVSSRSDQATEAGVVSNEKSILIRIGRSISTPPVVSPVQVNRRQHIFDGTISAASSTTSPSRSVTAQISSITSSFATLLSPQRRKSTNGVVSSTAMCIDTSPRQGMNSKRSRNSHAYAITDNFGWSQCSVDDFACFSVGDQFVIVIPSDHKTDDKYSITQRKQLRSRILTAVGAIIAQDTPTQSSKAPLRKPSDRTQQQEAQNHLLLHHGIHRNRLQYIELRCRIHKYPHRDDYVNDRVSVREVTRHLHQNEGIYFELLDYTRIPKSDANIVHFRWCEIPHIQVWTTYYRGDMRSPITISSERGTVEYVTEMESHYHNFKDDPSRLCELLLAHERKKNDYLVKTVRQLECHKSKAILASQTLGEKYTLNQLRDEMLDNRLPEFAALADGLYRDALVEHYSDFQPNSALLSNSQLLLLYQKIQTTFPMHFASLHSMIYGKRSQEPARAQSQYNLDKRFVLIHYFFCLLRERDRHILTHWAIVATIALHYRGVDNNVYRNTAGRSSTTDLHYAIEKLDDIFLSTAPTLMAIFTLQRFIRHVLDNYNRFQRFSTQRCGTSGIFHNGIVFSAILAKEFNKPRGTILMNKDGEQWRVLNSFLSVDYRYNYVDVELVHTKSSESLTGESDLPPTHVAQQTITLPSLQWKVVSMQGQSDTVPCTYINQEIPSSLRQRVPTQLRDCDLILRDRSWMAEIQSTDESRKLGVREYASLVQDATELLNMIMMIKQPLNANYNTADYENLSQLKSELKSNLLDPNPCICSNVEQFQKHFCEYFDESYHAVDRYVWLPLLPKNEMLKDELFLATLSILEQFGVIDNSTGTPISIDASNSWRRIFQFGDVLTQQKLHHLNPSVLKKMTHIGNEGNAMALHSLLTKTCVRNHDYLHENIHRLQGIYRIYFSGFINVCASVIGTKRVGMDPTKGRWRDHEHMVQKMVAALHRLRFDKFLTEELGNDDVAQFNSNIDQEARLWSLHKKYKAYCQSLSMSCNEVTQYVTNFMTMVDKWEACKQAVRIGDWSVLEVEAIDWLPVWGLVKKPLYSMETMRRMEINYGLSAEELEYMRMGRLFRMHPNGKFMSLDDFCEKHNYAMKQCSNHPDIQVMCAKSRHLHLASRCAKMMFGNEGRKASSTPKIGDDVDALHKFFVKCNIFGENSVPCALTDLTFAKEVEVEQFNNSKQRAAIDLKRNITINVMEKNLLKSLKGGETTVVHDIDDESDHSESDGDNASDSSNPFDGIDEESLQTMNTEDGASVHDDENDIGATTTGAMGKINKLGLRNVFSFNTEATIDAIQKRLRTVKEEKEWQETIQRCVKHFQTKMERKISLLKVHSETRHDRVNREESLHEMEMRLSRERYMGV